MKNDINLHPVTVKRISVIILLFLLFVSDALTGQELPIYNPKEIFQPVASRNGMVSSADAYATRAGLRVLREGGNAIDAAVTVGFTLAVTFPRAGNLGGGGFMLIYKADSKRVVAIDYREKAPKASSRDMFLDESGNVDSEKSLHSLLAVGVPGTVAGLAIALEKYGTITLKRALQPAIELAGDGFPMDSELRRSLFSVKERMMASPASMKIFYKEGGVSYDEGEIFKQEDLAWSLEQIAKYGPIAFYKGKITEKIVDYMNRGGGLITSEDLASYHPLIREPVHGTYRGYDIYSMPPPSSGGVHLIQMLNVLERFPRGLYGHNTAKTIHILVETMKLAFADRSKYLGDPDFSPVPVAGLTSKDYAEELQRKINIERATASQRISPGNPSKNKEGVDTTHFSVIDRYGNAVSNTYTLNFSYGTKLTVPGTGILLNNEMDDFSSKPGVPNAYGLIGGQYNSIESEKRMLSSMTPTIVLKDRKPYLLTGSPGGSRIITAVLQLILNIVDFNMNIASATNAVRVHHQWLPDEVVVEEGLNGDTVRLLTEMGHMVVIGNTIGTTQSVMKIGDFLYGASDPRTPGGLTEGY
ncbi:MAG: gamma-glutamyltransferase [Deltaproteobacteria bacterium]|nr:gamma-glutamyltransferase [Deltaproteobacteria bacterium]